MASPLSSFDLTPCDESFQIVRGKRCVEDLHCVVDVFLGCEDHAPGVALDRLYKIKELKVGRVHHRERSSPVGPKRQEFRMFCPYQRSVLVEPDEVDFPRVNSRDSRKLVLKSKGLGYGLLFYETQAAERLFEFLAGAPPLVLRNPDLRVGYRPKVFL